MCTLIVMRNVFAGRSLVIAANRDERLSRPSEPASVEEIGGLRVLRPRDLERGGTWIGVNAAGVFAGLTNRTDVASVRGTPGAPDRPKSRGALVRTALSAPTADLALAAVLREPIGDHNGFHLAIADRSSAYIVFGNGYRPASGDPFRVEEMGDGMNVVTNLGCGPDTRRAQGIRRTFDRIRADRSPPRPIDLAPMLGLHGSDVGGAGHFRRPMDANCLHPIAGDEDYGTKSSAVIRLNDIYGYGPPTWDYWHAERAVSTPASCRVAWNPEIRLGIGT